MTNRNLNHLRAESPAPLSNSITRPLPAIMAGSISAKRLLLLFAALVLAVPLVGFAIIRQYSPQIEHETYANLTTIARLKAEQIENWMGERYGDCGVLAGDDAFAVRAAQFVQHEQDAKLSSLILNRFEHLITNYHYTKILLLNTSGRMLLASGGDITTSPVPQTVLHQVLDSKQMQRSDIYRDKEGDIHLDWVVPLFVSDAQGKRMVAVVVLRVTAQHFIYPLIQTWPSASPSSETLLVRRDGESVLYLNQLRHRNFDPMTFRLPLATPDLPAAIAIRKDRPGTVAGVDYRGVPVLAAQQAVAGTNWYLVAKTDRAEALMPLRNFALWISLICLAAIVAVSTVVVLLWRQQQRANQVEIRVRSIEAIKESERRFRAIVQAANDAIITADSAGNIVKWNPGAERIFGYHKAEILGQSIARLMPERYRERHCEGFARVASGEESRIIGKTVEFEGLRKDGGEFPLELSLAQWRTASGRFFSATIRDITERKQSAQVLAESEQRFRGVVEQSLSGIYIIQDGRFVYVNPRFAEIFGYASASELVGTDPLLLVAEQDRGIVMENIRSRIESGVPSISYGFSAVRKGGSLIDVGVHGAHATHDGRPAIIGLMQDVSEKKRSEKQIQRYVAQLEHAFMNTIEVVTNLVEMRDPYTAGHEKRVGQIAAAIGAELGLDANRIEGLRVGGYVHDIGKIIVPAEILSKPGKISAAEYELIKGHPQAGYDILKKVDFPWPVADIAHQHHERMDGSGYPQGLKGEEILLEARITAVADVVEAMSAHRPYRPGIGLEKALAEIERGRGALYDTEAADACLRLFREKGYVLPG